MINTINGGIVVDERGIIRFANDFDFSWVKRFYQVSNHDKGFIRAWHGHIKESKGVYVAKGSIWLGIVDMKTEEISKIVLSDQKPTVAYIPKEHYNGFMTLEEDTIVFFFSDTYLEQSMNDDIRLPYEQYPIFKKEYR